MGEKGVPTFSACLCTTPALVKGFAQWCQKLCPLVRHRRTTEDNEGLAGQYLCANMMSKHLPQPSELGVCLCNFKLEESDKHDSKPIVNQVACYLLLPDLLRHPLLLSFFFSVVQLPLILPCSPPLVLEFISPFEELTIRKRFMLPGSFFSLHVRKWLCWTRRHGIKGWCMWVQFPFWWSQKGLFAVSWGEQEQVGSFCSIFSFSVLLVPEATGGLMGCWLTNPGKSSNPALQSFLGNCWLLAGCKVPFNDCMKLFTLGGVMFKFLELKAKIFTRSKG